jgi:hypothetical protein
MWRAGSYLNIPSERKRHFGTKKHQKYLAAESLVEVNAPAKNLESSDAPEL